MKCLVVQFEEYLLNNKREMGISLASVSEGFELLLIKGCLVNVVSWAFNCAVTRFLSKLFCVILISKFLKIFSPYFDVTLIELNSKV